MTLQEARGLNNCSIITIVLIPMIAALRRRICCVFWCCLICLPEEPAEWDGGEEICWEDR